MIDLIWCGRCAGLRRRSDLPLRRGQLVCPVCGQELRTSAMTVWHCGRCGRRILCAEDDRGQVRCDCVHSGETESPPSAVLPAGGEENPSGPAEPFGPAAVPAAEETVPPDDGGYICWRPRSKEDIVFEHPRGRRLRFGDMLKVEAGQAAVFECGGRSFRVAGPALRLVGYDDRPGEEIRLAYRLGERTGLPPMIDTRIVFFDIRKRGNLEAEPPEPLTVGTRFAFLPSFRFSLRVSAPDLFLGAFGVPDASAQAVERLAAVRLGKMIAQRLERAEAADAEALIRLEASAAEDLNGVNPCADLGLYVEDAVQTGCRFWKDFCPVCRAPVRRGDPVCPAGHPLEWCPDCGRVLDGGVCANGHRFVYCGLCGRNVRTADGRCPHHGSLGLRR